MPHLGAMELGVILLLVVMIFGVGKLPELGAGLGKSIRGFREAVSGDEQASATAEPEQDKETAA